MAIPAMRALIRDWRTTALTVASIALAIAANTTVFSLLEALIYPQMEMKAPDRLYWVDFYGDHAHRLSASRRDSILTAHGATFALTTWQRSDDNAIVLEHGDRFLAVTAARVGPAFFTVTGITAVIGRVLTLQDTNADPASVVLSQSVAVELFARNSPVGSVIRYGGVSRRVVGVVSDRADFPNNHTGVWSFGGDLQLANHSKARLIRVRAGYDRRDVERALDSASVVVAGLVHESPGLEVAFRIAPALQTQFRYQKFHYAIGAACIALFLIACANAANLEISRALGRRRELAIRSALGANPLTLIRGVLREQAILVGVATCVGLAATWVAAHAVYSLVPRSVGDFVIEPHVGWRVVTFAALIAGVGVFLVGCTPAIRAGRTDPQEALKSAAGTGLNHRRYYAILVSTELGLAIALSCGGIVMMRAALGVDETPLGYNITGLVQGFLRQDRPPDARDGMEVVRRRLASVPGVTSAAVTLQTLVRNHEVTVEDSTGALIEYPAPDVHYLIVTPGYLETLGIPVAEGPGFNPAVSSESQVILDRTSANRLWPGRDPIGQSLKLGAIASNLPFGRVVGVIAEPPLLTRRNVLGPPPAAHTLGGIFVLPGSDDPLTATPYDFREYGFVARTGVNAPRVVLGIKRSLVRVDNAAYSHVALADDDLGISRARASRRFLTQLFVFFAVCGLGLTGVAMLCVVTRSVEERRREIAVRRALGAQTYQILHAVLREMVPVGLLGVAIGLALTKYAIPLLGSQALPDDRFNASLFAITSTVVLIALGVCGVVPALGATRVPTREALRSL